MAVLYTFAVNFVLNKTQAYKEAMAKITCRQSVDQSKKGNLGAITTGEVSGNIDE